MTRIKMLDKKSACALAGKTLMGLGFLLVRKSKQTGSQYFFKSGSNFKVRVSDHRNGSSQYPDVAFNLVFDYPTIQPDVMAQCQSIARDFDSLVRNKTRIKT